MQNRQFFLNKDNCEVVSDFNGFVLFKTCKNLHNISCNCEM